MYKYTSKTVIKNGRETQVFIPTKGIETNSHTVINAKRVACGIAFGGTLLVLACIALAHYNFF